MQKSLGIRLLFYQNFVWITFFISIFGCYLVWRSGTATFILPVFYIKMITNGLIGVMVHFFKHSQLYFFQNLGISTIQLYTSALFIDMVLWLSATLLIIMAL